jgi:hypothetical protein
MRLTKKEKAAIGGAIFGAAALIIGLVLLTPLVLWLIWTYVVMAVFVTAPAMTFWQMFWMWVGLYFAAGVMRANVTVKKEG